MYPHVWFHIKLYTGSTNTVQYNAKTHTVPVANASTLEYYFLNVIVNSCSNFPKRETGINKCKVVRKLCWRKKNPRAPRPVRSRIHLTERQGSLVVV